ncbi:serine/threonine-protein kinase [Lysinibacillus antri]|uniref:Serine/threonine protein kinase n=1 Tax=Lysinibacillus antri TaxID=2498145 RepID=A0A3S0RWD2_9BACI|nr:serine/threonine-protein kinase [Lysinibacillus antri]RUL54016.1 serine/threonine protein kinase [Lysinibacillus antri]
MGNDWAIARDSLSKITVVSNPNNELVTIHGIANDLKCIGIGTDAAVFQSVHVPQYAFKVYAKDKKSKVKIEQNVYYILGGSPYFSTCYAADEEYLVLSYEAGTSLFDCILQGIHIPKQIIQDVDDAREYVRKRGLNPRDIHLKNILLQNGRAKVLDVSEYTVPGNDFRWEHLKKGYEQYYHLIDGRPVPFWLAEAIRKWYNQRKEHFSFEELSKTMFHLLYKK